MRVLLDLATVVDLTAERPARRTGARLLSEYQGAGLSYALAPPGRTHWDVEQVLRSIGLDPVTGLLSEGSAAWWDGSDGNKILGVLVSSNGTTRPRSWGLVKFDPAWPFHVLVQEIWKAVPANAEAPS